MAFLKFILIAFAVYFVVRFLFRLFLPFAMRKAAEKLMKKAQQQGGAYGSQGSGGTFYYEFNGQGQQESKRSQPEGKVHVDYIPPKDGPERKGTETAGEFVDFEEIK
ncbi:MULTISPECIES: DUF4834 family protein [Sphingobacterium]|jgi:Domain of unknown function (DUF4834)|uniref:DUF4834 family protein n=1 Tax=Sphingobacterium TaxID=28453 RepID=UPI0008A3DD59|nr:MULTISPECIES: DUF4834 family protein [Sphingobacterium]HAU54781.1 DUF4834 domain-containing protein [Sphingobacterium sp.]MDF2852791.1 hypothetical protein [Sphingobacterium multivorum]OFV21762.1 hypothetical protein HMPREF3127_00070 [Sphingobacterium sp. HMSC13C05]OJZ02203.1 MAG: hypothetical protein BGP15_12080 [Sphingobacterium sp. 40-24]HCX59002.1 DUF4834 domain-containing protein [Sphingobacterium sp.]